MRGENLEGTKIHQKKTNFMDRR